MDRKTTELSRAQKILLTLFKLSKGSNRQVRFEDIAVSAYKNFKSDFQLKGYPQYPDTGDIIHKPLYSELKKNGYVLSGNKYFSLTAKGIEYSKSLINKTSKSPKDMQATKSVKLTSDQEKELDRLRKSKAVELFLSGRKEEILDIDFYSYLGVTVRTDKNSFLGRISTVEDAVECVKDVNNGLYLSLKSCHKYILERFKENVDFVRNTKGGKR